jgi:hypothetical protein
MSALGFQVTNSADIVPHVKYDSRAGRWSKIDRTQGASGWESNATDFTQNVIFVIDLANIEVGWVHFGAQGPSYAMSPVGQKQPDQPSKDHRQGFKVMLFSEKNLDGVRVWSTNAKCVLTAIDELYVAYKAAPESAQGKLPVVQMTDVLPVKTNGKDAAGKPVSSTNYAPVFKILQWVDRPQALGATVTPITAAQGAPAAQPAPAPTPMPQQPQAAANGAGSPLF